jgi:hypothetical protein
MKRRQSKLQNTQQMKLQAFLKDSTNKKPNFRNGGPSISSEANSLN